MKDYLVYHNPDSMGYKASLVKRALILTNKKAAGIEGSRIWMITGEGKPRTYYLCGYFLADTVEINQDGGYQTVIRGRWCKRLRRQKWPVLNEKNWFDDFRSNHGNFAFGLQPITNIRFIHSLEKLVR